MMQASTPVSDEKTRQVIDRYGDMLFRICAVILKNEQDAEDAVQDTFIRWYSKAPDFENEQHEKAWLIRVAANICKDKYRFGKRHSTQELQDIYSYCSNEDEYNVMDAVCSLNEKYKTAVLLHYVEGYSVEETAEILNISRSAVKMRLSRAREQLGKILKEDL